MATTRAAARKTIRRNRRPKADTAEVLGNAVAPPKIPAKWQPHYRKLISMRDHLVRERGQRVQEAQEQPQAVSQEHIADAGTDSYDRDFALGIASSEQEAVFEIEEALSRIKTGRYGTCEASGKEIDPARLEAIPWTRFSAEAERELERNNAISRPRLGEVEDLPRQRPLESDEETEG
jgi:RNA polymerase-binding transcription factor DksA